jgi:assimilatory nitrate reductase catalytic subunit
MRDPLPVDELRETRSVCPYCGTGCGVIVQSRGASIVGVRGDPAHPANFGKLCPKGNTLHLTATPEVLLHARLRQPSLRVGKDAPREVVTWGAALDHAADRFAETVSRGGDRAAFYVSGQLLTEDYYVFNKLARALVGTNQIDSNSRLCMSSAVVGYKRTLGSDSPPCSYEDLELADCVFITGANPAAAHPVLFGRLLEARRTRGTRFVVVDPRCTDTTRAADLHLQIAPGADLYLLTAMLHVLLRDGTIDERYIASSTEGFEAVAASAQRLDLRSAAQTCGLKVADIERAAREFARAPATLSLYCQGLNQSIHGSDNTAALIHLHLATGQIGRPGAGPFSLTGQPNAMGGRESGTMATLLPGHRDPAVEADRAEVARLWGIDALPAQPGLTAVELFEAAADGAIDALWIACTNPAQSLPDQRVVRAALARVAFVVVQDAFAQVETNRFADLLLPAATFGERAGTSTNSERRIALSRAAVPAAGEARPDWEIAADFARRLACRIAPDRERLFAWATASEVFDEYKRFSAGRELDFSGLSYETLDRIGPQQWPWHRAQETVSAASDGTGAARLYLDGRFPTPSGRARFVPIELRMTAEAPSAEFPFSLTTTRLRDQWHGGSRSGLVGALAGAMPAVELAPASLHRLGAADDDLVRVASARGQLVLPVRANETLAETLAVIPMHYGRRWLPASDGVNALTMGTGAIDPLSKQPELKHAAVQIEPVRFGWHLAALGWLHGDDRHSQAESLRELAAGAGFAAIAVFGRDDGRDGGRLGVIVSAAHDERLPALVDQCVRLLRVAVDSPTLRDAGAGRKRRVQLDGGRIAAVILEGRQRSDIAASSAYRSLIEHGTDCSRHSLRELFAPAGN